MLGARDFGARGVAGPEVLGPDARRAGRGWPQRQRPLLACGGCGGWCLREQADAVRALAGSGQIPAVLVGHSHGRTIVTAAAAASPGLVAGVIYLDAAVPRSGESTSGTWPDSLRAELAGTVRGGQLPAPAESAELAGADACRPWPQCWAALMAQVCRGAETVAVPSGYIRCSPKPSWYERARSAIAGRGGRTPVISGGHPMLTEPAVTARAVARMAGQLLEVP